MTMKNIFCLDGAEEKYYNGYFDCCHVALDSYILDWVYKKSKILCLDKEDKNIVIKFLEGNNKIKAKQKNLIKDNLHPWSYIVYNEEDKNDNHPCMLSYVVIQIIINEILIPKFNEENKTDYKPFEAEFMIWNNERY